MNRVALVLIPSPQFPIEQWVGTPGSCGQLVSGTVAKIVKVDGTLARVEEPGELWIQGPQVVLGYYRNDDACVFPLSSWSASRLISGAGCVVARRRPSSTGENGSYEHALLVGS